MNVVGSREVKEHFYAYLRKAQKGRATVVTHRGKPIARLVPITERDLETVDEEELRYRKAVERGLIIPPKVEGGEAHRQLLAALAKVRKRGPIGGGSDKTLDWVRGDERP